MKKYLALVITMFVVLNMVPLQQIYAQGEITVKFNDKKLEFDARPYVKDGRTLVPFRKILEAFNAEISWNGEEQIVTAKTDTTEIHLKIGVDYGYVNGSKVNFDVPPEITGGRTFVPLRFISENLGAQVIWNAANKSVSIDYNNNTYKLGQEGTYKGLKFSINKVDTISEAGVLKVAGKLSHNEKGIVIEVADDYGYILKGQANILSKTGEMYNMEAKVYLPGCHDFVSTYIIIKKQDPEQKLIKIAEYKLQ